VHPTQPPAPSKSLGNRCPSPAKKETGNLGVLRKKEQLWIVVSILWGNPITNQYL
jgi:hypothetical protein